MRGAVVEEIVNTVLAKIPGNHLIKKDELVLTVDEAVTNAMEHGNRWDPDKNIHVGIRLTDKELIIRIKDEGMGFDTGILESSGNNRKSGLSMRGRGISLITRLSRATWNPKGNQVEMRISLF